MDIELIEAMLCLTYDAPCKFFYEKEGSLYFIIESRSSKSLGCNDGEVICDNFIETRYDGQISNCYNFALKTEDYIIVEVEKQLHGENVRDKLVVYNNVMDKISEFIDCDDKKYCIKLLDDKIRCIKDSINNIYYNLDGSILQK